MGIRGGRRVARQHAFSVVAAASCALAGVVPAAAQPAAPVVVGVAHADVRGFDTCAAPSTGLMRSWLASPYRAVNIYLRSPNLAPACRAQPELTPQWVHTVRSNNWRLLPVYAGLQAPCRDDRSLAAFSAGNARSKGRAAADAAVQRMQALKIGQHNPIYLDIEQYATKKVACAKAVVDYVEAWTLRLHRLDYVAGVYAPAKRGIEPIAQKASPRPDDVWWALYNGNTSTSYPTLHGHWKHHRIHQYAAESLKQASTYNGQGPLQIDKDSVDADVVGTLPASATSQYRVSTPYDTSLGDFIQLKERSAPRKDATIEGYLDYGTVLDIQCQTTGDKVYGDRVWDRLADNNYVLDLYTTTTGGLGFTGRIGTC